MPFVLWLPIKSLQIHEFEQRYNACLLRNPECMCFASFLGIRCKVPPHPLTERPQATRSRRPSPTWQTRGFMDLTSNRLTRMCLTRTSSLLPLLAHQVRLEGYPQLMDQFVHSDVKMIKDSTKYNRDLESIQMLSPPFKAKMFAAIPKLGTLAPKSWPESLLFRTF